MRIARWLPTLPTVKKVLSRRGIQCSVAIPDSPLHLSSPRKRGPSKHQGLGVCTIETTRFVSTGNVGVYWIPARAGMTGWRFPLLMIWRGSFRGLSGEWRGVGQSCGGPGQEPSTLALALRWARPVSPSSARPGRRRPPSAWRPSDPSPRPSGRSPNRACRSGTAPGRRDGW